MDEAQSIDDFAKQQFEQNQLYDFELEENADSVEENRSTSNTDKLSERRNTKVYLQNLPKHLKQNGLKNLCGQYGVIKYCLFWDDRNYAFVTFGSLSEAENAIRKINDNNTLGIKAAFAFENTNKLNKKEIFDELHQMVEEPNFDADIDWSGRKVKGPFSQPQRIPDEINTMKTCATAEDYCENGDLCKADPYKEFINQIRNNSTAEFATLRRRIVNGRSVHILNDDLLQKFKENSELSLGSYVASKVTYSFRNVHLPDLLTFTSNCVKCNELSSQYCRKCDAPFCSMICEANDDIHKEICATEKVYEFKDAVDANRPHGVEDEIEMLSTKWIQKSNTEVKLVCFVDFRTVYVRPSNACDEMEFIRLLNDVAKAAKTSPKMKTPKCGHLALAPFEMSYHRVLILKLLNEHESIVAFIDYGNVEAVDIANLKIMPSELKRKPRMVTKFILKNVPNTMCNDRTMTILYDLLNTSVDLTVRFDEPYVPGVTECELMTASTDSVNRIINELNVPWDQLESTEYENEMQYVDITGENVPVLIVDNSLLCSAQLSVIRSADIDLFQRNDQLIQTVADYLYKDEAHNMPRLMEICLAKVDEKWYRVQAIEVSFDRHVTALFIDHGNIDVLNITCIRKMPKILRFPCITATVQCFDTDADTKAVEAIRQKVLPIFKLLSFEELTHKNDVYEGNCNGILPFGIYNKVSEYLKSKSDIITM